MTQAQAEPEVETMSERETKHDVCVVGPLAWRRKIEPCVERLKIDGFTVWAPWIEEPDLKGLLRTYDNLDSESPYLAKAHGALAQVKMACLLAIQQARCVVLFQPAGADCHMLAGYAQARNVPVIVHDLAFADANAALVPVTYRRGVMAFDWPLTKDIESLVHWVNLYAREIPARRAGAKGEGVPLVRIGSGPDARDIEAR